jgi:hypothetical protein
MLGQFNRRQQITVFVFAIANFCSAICVSLQVRSLAFYII